MDKSTKQLMDAMKRQNNRPIIILSLVAAIALIVTILVIVIIHAASKRSPADDINDAAELVIGSKSDAQVIENHTSIEDIIGISDLQTLNYDYQAICRVYDEEDHVTPVYYIAYEATVALGIKTSNIEIDYGEPDDKEITITLPRVVILNTVVNAGTLEYLFIDKSYNNQKTSVEAQGRCEEDVIRRVREDQKMFQFAKDNTEAEIRALTEPLIKQLYPDYSLKIIWKE